MANGNFAGGNGSPANPYLIEDAHDLNAVRNNLTASYKLINDIDLNIAPYNTGEGWIPIGGNTTALSFRGRFDGNAKRIYNLYMRSKLVGALFANLIGCYIKDLIIFKPDIENGSGGILANSVSISMSANRIERCAVIGGSIKSDSNGSGFVYGTSSNPADYVTSYIENCYSSANVINGTAGFIGYVKRMLRVENCYYSGMKLGSVGGFANNGESNATVRNCFWDKDVSEATTTKFGSAKTTAEMKTPSTFASWSGKKLEDGTPVWVLEDGEYPRLWFEKLVFFLIKSSNKIKKLSDTGTWVDIELTEPFTKRDFESHGFTNLSAITKEQWDQLGDFKILTWTNDYKCEVKTKSKNLELDNDYIGSGKLFRVELRDIVKVNKINIS